MTGFFVALILLAVNGEPKCCPSSPHSPIHVVGPLPKNNHVPFPNPLQGLFNDSTGKMTFKR